MSKHSSINIGYIPLLDAAPLLLAQELGFFGDAGLNVQLSREASWANIRDKLYVGSLHGAHLLAPMTISVSLGLNRVKAPLVTSFVMSLNGNAITVSNSLREQLRSVNPEALASASTSVLTLKKLIDQRREQGRSPLTFAVVYPYSCHNYLLRYWLGAGGINPDHDLNIVVIPPAQMVSQLAAGRIDGFCVGEPWNQIAVAQGHGKVLLSTFDIWHNAPEKVFAVHRDWAQANTDANLELISSLLKACQWMEEPANRNDAWAILGQAEYLGFGPEILQNGLQCGKHVFFKNSANHPWPVQGLWLLSQMQRWGHIPGNTKPQELVHSLYRPDLYLEAALHSGQPVPARELRQLGLHTAPWHFDKITLGSDRFIDGLCFHADKYNEYLNAFETSNLDAQT